MGIVLTSMVLKGTRLQHVEAKGCILLQHARRKGKGVYASAT